MADIGVQPTKTTIRLTSSTGESGTITAASAAQAGVMSAAQAAQLEQLVSRLQDGSLSNVTLLPPAVRSAVPVDAVTRADLQAALDTWREHVLQEVNTILTRIRAEVPVVSQVSGIDNVRLERLETAVIGLNQEIEALKATLGTLGEISAAFAQQGAAA